MKVYFKYYILPLLYGLIFSLNLLKNIEGKIDISDIIGLIGNGDISNFTSECVLVVIIGSFVFYMYIIIFSSYIYRHFCNSSVYVFSRCSNRLKWYTKESFKLLLFTFLNTIVLVLGYLITSFFNNGITYSENTLYLTIIYIIMTTLITYAAVLLSNILSIKFNNVIGTIVSLGILLTLTIALTTIDFYNFTDVSKWKMCINPMAYTMMSWYKIPFNSSWEMSESIPYALNPYVGFLLCGIFCILVFVIGAVIIKKIDIINNNED